MVKKRKKVKQNSAQRERFKNSFSLKTTVTFT